MSIDTLIERLWPNGFGPKNFEEIAVFIEEERKCEAEYRIAIHASTQAEILRLKTALENVAERHLAFREMLIALMDASPPNETAEAFVSRLTEAMEVVADAFDDAISQDGEEGAI